jgi:2C-methyl-D-erythritol 2,4-cyclodiphosphate synthase
MEENLASVLGADPALVNLKVTSTDHLGAIGREEGMAALAVVSLRSEPLQS